MRCAMVSPKRRITTEVPTLVVVGWASLRALYLASAPLMPPDVCCADVPSLDAEENRRWEENRRCAWRIHGGRPAPPPRNPSANGRRPAIVKCAEPYRFGRDTLNAVSLLTRLRPRGGPVLLTPDASGVAIRGGSLAGRPSRRVRGRWRRRRSR